MSDEPNNIAYIGFQSSRVATQERRAYHKYPQQQCPHSISSPSYSRISSATSLMNATWFSSHTSSFPALVPLALPQMDVRRSTQPLSSSAERQNILRWRLLSGCP